MIWELLKVYVRGFIYKYTYMCLCVYIYTHIDQELSRKEAWMQNALEMFMVLDPDLLPSELTSMQKCC